MHRKGWNPFSRCIAPVAVILLIGLIASVPGTSPGADAGPATSQRNETGGPMLESAGIRGGLVVHLGCGNGQLTADLAANDRCLVHGLETDPELIDQARAHLRKRGLYGTISVDRYDGRHLPYADDLVNVIVVSGPIHVAADELSRVLAPRGVIVDVADDSPEVNYVEPVPEAIDEWTHSLHGPGCNPVAADRLVGPPRHLRWTAGPLWARSHGWTPSVSAMVSSGGRLFCICDETLACADGAVPSKWSLIARDAFSGVLLWKRPIREWGSGAFSGTPNTGGGGVVGRFTMPPNVSKRLVAVGDTVFVTLGPAAPITALDAATGEQKQVYTGTAGADEILCTGDRLVVSINPPMERRPESVDSRSTPPPAPGKRVRAIDVETGETLWERGPFEAVRASISQDPFGRIELAAGDGRALLLTSRSIVCLELDSGDVAWQVERPKLPEQAVRQIGFAGMYEFRLSVMVYHDGVVLLAQPEPNTHHTYHTMPGTLYAFDAANGRLLWKRSYGGWGHCTPPDVFVADGAVWTHVDAQTDYGHVWRNGLRAKDSSNVDYRIQALDLRTGRTIREVSTRDIFNVGHHHRCYRNRMTSQFLLSCRRGVEFVDLDDGDNYQNHWVRSGCLLGYLPCNGLLYVTPHPCSCYINAKLVGFNALAASMAQKSADVDRRAPRLHRGPVYEGIELRDAPSAAADDWPTYRHDPQRSGATEAYLGPELIRVWQTQLGTVPGAPVAAGGKVLVAGGDDHSIHALDAESGKVLWTYTTGARVDSPPTLYRGLALFGSRDGRVYCLRIADGELVWRFDAAPTRRLVTAFGQLESAWPVPGSVLIDEGRCWFAAGRASHLDGGIRLYALDPRTGEILHEETLSSVDPETNKIPVETSAQQMHGLLNDIPASDGADVFIRQMQVASSGGKAGLRLYSSGGFLDPSWFNRTFWHAGRVRTSGLMVLGDGVAYGMEVYESRSRETVFRPGGNAYRLRCISLRPTKSKPADKAAARRRRRHGQKPEWEVRTGIRVTAMARAGERLFSAGSPDIVDPDDPHGAWEGRKGGRLAVFAAADGKKLAEYRLAAPPAWDAMAVAEGRLLLSTRDGSVVCFAGEK